MTTLRSRVAAHPIASFFVLAYAISWSIDLAVRFAGMEPSWTRWFFAGFLSALGPPIAAAVVTVVAFPLGEEAINFLWYSILPGTDVARPRVYHPLALILARLKVATLAGFIVALPVFVYQSYQFMKPGLYPHERRYYLASVPTSLVLATVGVLFAYFLVLPALFTYFLYYSDEVTVIAFGLTETFDLMVLMLGGFAFIFQIPLFVMLAIMMGVTSRRWLASRRLYFWAGFAGNTCSSPVKGLTPLRSLRAGVVRTLSFIMSGITNSPGPRRPSSRLLRSRSAPKTLWTSFLVSPVFSDSSAISRGLARSRELVTAREPLKSCTRSTTASSEPR